MSDDGRDGRIEEEVPLAALRRLAAHADAPPPDVVAAAHAAFAWRTVDAELEELANVSFDSSLSSHDLVGVRGGAAPRQLTFEAGGLTVEVEVDLDARPQLNGQLIPPQAIEVEVRAPAGVRTLLADELGRFSLSGLTPGPLSLRCAPAGGTAAVSTEWILI